MTKLICSIVFALGLVLSAPAHAAVSPLSVALLPPLQFPPDDFSITGARLSILWGDHRDIYGFDLGLLGNITEQRFVGLGVSGLLNLTHGQTTVIGFQAAGAANYNTEKTGVYGAQMTLGLNYNQAASTVAGVQLAPIANFSPFTEIYGLQVGLFNKAQDVYGLQIGLVNFASSLHGLQIGLLNFQQKGIFAVSPILNFGF